MVKLELELTDIDYDTLLQEYLPRIKDKLEKSGSPLAGMLSGGMGLSLAPQDPGGDAATALVFMLNNLSGIDWSIRDVLKGSDTAKGIVGFRFEDSMEGTVELTLIRLEKEWRIDNLNMPHFDRLSPHR